MSRKKSTYGWDQCSEKGCVGARTSRGRCLAHLPEEDLEAEVENIRQHHTVDARGVRLDAVLINKLTETMKGSQSRLNGLPYVTARFDQAVFENDVRFMDFAFRTSSSFEAATFQRSGWFIHAVFEGDISFKGTSFKGDADFRVSRFLGNAEFSKSMYGKTARFQGAGFVGSSDFTEARFNTANFSGAIFSGPAEFQTCTFTGDLDFLNATFSDLVTFTQCQFLGKSQFNTCHFDDVAAVVGLDARPFS